MKSLIFLAVFMLTCVGFSNSKNLPSYLQLCHRKDPKINECLMKNIDIIIPKLMGNGIPELLIPSLNPLVIKEAGLENGDNFKASFKDIQIYHANEFKIQNLMFDLDKYKVDIKITFPRIRILSTYKVNGRILILQLNGNGPADGNFTFYFIKQCHRSDPQVNACLRQSSNQLILHMRRGIPELDVTDPEPIIIDEIPLALGSGPDGYRAIFRNIEAYGVSNCTVTAVRSDIDTNQFQFTLHIPKISARAKYESSGVLILVQASGGGNYWGEYEDVKVKAYLKGAPRIGSDGKTYLQLQQMKMDFSVKDIKMGVDGIHNGNSVIQAALNLFINSNAQELLKEMKPFLKKKLLLLMSDFVSKIFDRVPYDAFIVQ